MSRISLSLVFVVAGFGYAGCQGETTTAMDGQGASAAQASQGGSGSTDGGSGSGGGGGAALDNVAGASGRDVCECGFPEVCSPIMTIEETATALCDFAKSRGGGVVVRTSYEGYTRLMMVRHHFFTATFFQPDGAVTGASSAFLEEGAAVCSSGTIPPALEPLPEENPANSCIVCSSDGDYRQANFWETPDCE